MKLLIVAFLAILLPTTVGAAERMIVRPGETMDNLVIPRVESTRDNLERPSIHAPLVYTDIRCNEVEQVESILISLGLSLEALEKTLDELNGEAIPACSLMNVDGRIPRINVQQYPGRVDIYGQVWDVWSYSIRTQRTIYYILRLMQRSPATFEN